MMTRRLLLELAAFIAIFAGLWFLFYKLSLVPQDKPLQLPVAQEEKIGNVMRDAILQHENKLNNDTIDETIQIIYDRLYTQLDSSVFDYEIFVLENDGINAFALPGGKIFVFSGLLKFAESPEEVAAVIAHEMGHVEHRDVMSRLAKEIGISVIFTMITGGDQGVISEISKTALSTVFDREQETRADEFACQLLSKAKIKPSAMAVFFQRLIREGKTYNKEIEFLMTHPHDSKRIEAVLKYKLPRGFRAQKFDAVDWKQIHSILK